MFVACVEYFSPQMTQMFAYWLLSTTGVAPKQIAAFHVKPQRSQSSPRSDLYFFDLMIDDLRLTKSSSILVFEILNHKLSILDFFLHSPVIPMAYRYSVDGTAFVCHSFLICAYLRHLRTKIH